MHNKQQTISDVTAYDVVYKKDTASKMELLEEKC